MVTKTTETRDPETVWGPLEMDPWLCARSVFHAAQEAVDPLGFALLRAQFADRIEKTLASRAHVKMLVELGVEQTQRSRVFFLEEEGPLGWDPVGDVTFASLGWETREKCQALNVVEVVNSLTVLNVGEVFVADGGLGGRTRFTRKR